MDAELSVLPLFARGLLVASSGVGSCCDEVDALGRSCAIAEARMLTVLGSGTEPKLQVDGAFFFDGDGDQVRASPSGKDNGTNHNNGCGPNTAQILPYVPMLYIDEL